jgi:hypothetical protein
VFASVDREYLLRRTVETFGSSVRLDQVDIGVLFSRAIAAGSMVASRPRLALQGGPRQRRMSPSTHLADGVAVAGYQSDEFP